MDDKLPPEFDISTAGSSDLAGVLTIADALAHLAPRYLPYKLRVVWTPVGEVNGYGIAGNDVPSDLMLDDLRHHTANTEAVIRLESGGGISVPHAPELV